MGACFPGKSEQLQVKIASNITVKYWPDCFLSHDIKY